MWKLTSARKLLILQGVDALKQQKLDEALALFQKSIEQSPECRPAMITWALPGIARMILTVLAQPVKRRLN